MEQKELDSFTRKRLLTSYQDTSRHLNPLVLLAAPYLLLFGVKICTGSQLTNLLHIKLETERPEQRNLVAHHTAPSVL
eukprot:3001352-Rhodomonas_salina.2